MNEENHVCAYCGAPATYQLKNGKWCCQPTYNSCSGHTIWNKGLTKETDVRVRKQSVTMLKNYATGKNKGPWIGKHHSEETKQKLSMIMKQKILSGEMEAPYKHNHYSKGPSYPEQYFIDVFKNAGIPVEYNFQVGLYQLDFANPKSKKYVEIDGEQHYIDPRIIKHDEERTENLKKHGWTLVCRIRWNKFRKLSMEEKRSICFTVVGELS